MPDEPRTHLDPGPNAPPAAPPGLADSFRAYVAGFLSTLLGGALFPPVLFALLVVGQIGHVGTGQPAANRDWAGAAVFYSAFWIGIGTRAVAYTALEAAFVFPFVAVIHALVGSHRRRVAFVSLAGGCTGMAAAVFWLDGAGLAEVIAATLWGQLFAAGAARLLVARRPANSQKDDRLAWQFSLRRLLGIATATALALTVLVSVPLQPTPRLLIACGVAVQLLALGVFYAGAALVRRHPCST